MLWVIRMTISKEGFRSLYTGLSASILRQMTYSLTRLGVYEKIKETLSQHGKPSSGALLVGAMVAGGAGGIAGNPAGVARRARLMSMEELTALQTSCLFA